MNLRIPISKVDEERRLVYGIAADETPDHSGEIFDYAGSKPFFIAWKDRMMEKTGGKSQGAIRSMHSNIAAGKIEDMEFDDASKSIPICAKVVDDNEWRKCLEGVYSSFSIGGEYVKRWRDVVTGKTRYIANPIEVSLCDEGCNPNATFQIIKANGIAEQRHFKKEDVNMTDNQNPVADGAAVAEPIVEPVAKAANNAATEPETVTKAENPAVEPTVEELVEKAISKANELAKSGKKHSKETMAALTKMHHELTQLGAACKCDKCVKMCGDAEPAAKAAEPADLHKTDEPAEPVQKVDTSDELAKAVKGLADLQKAFDGFKSENEALKKQVEDLKNQPMPGGAIVQNGTAAVNKTVGSDPAPQPDLSPLDEEIARYESIAKASRIPMEIHDAEQKLAELKMKKTLAAQ
jgi:hypothetical protein